MKLGLEMETGRGEEICFKVSSAERLIQTLRFKILIKSLSKDAVIYQPFEAQENLPSIQCFMIAN